MTLPWAENRIIEYSKLLTDSYFFWTKRTLIEENADLRENAFYLYHAPFVLLTHSPGADPIINYANSKAQMLLGMSWEEIMKTPSGYLSRLDENNDSFSRFADTGKEGSISSYNTTLAAAAGLLFRITDSCLWKIMDTRKMCMGQAIMFTDLERAQFQST